MSAQDTKSSPLHNLTPQQRLFVEAYVLSFNGAKAAVEAKYSAKTARHQASRLLTSVNIQAAIKHLLGECMGPEEIAARWQRVATASLEDFYTRVEYEQTLKVQQPLPKAIEQVKEEIEWEYELMVRSWDVLRTSAEDQAKELLQHESWKRHRRMDILRWTMKLERDPKAFRVVDGPKVKKYRMELDLAKAESLGMLDLVKTHTDGKNGTSFSLRDQDAALDNLAKWRGMQTTKVDVTTKGESLAPQHDPAELAKKLSPEQLAAYRSIHDALHA
ncbi:terminase small subunit [uncultured Hymenobacter sp.]|uniref:terminase small subunit n=1 Tax=uncultured Hymenobacter sp. TaxID=170016 RepID=UPI0035CAB4BF